MILRPWFDTGRNVLLALTVLLVIVGAVAPAPALAREDADSSAEAIPETEPNDVRSAADRIELDRRVAADISPYDTDVFAFDVSQPGARIRVDAEKDAVGDYTDLLFSVFSEGAYLNGGAIDGSETSGTVLATAREAGTYYVHISVNHADYAYEFDVEASNVDGVPQERNRADATPLASDETANGTLTADREAWYAVNATAGDELAANLTTGQRYLTDVSVQIYGPSGAFVTGDAGRGDDHVRAATVAQADGVHYVYLTRDSRTPVDYALTATVRDTGDATEPNEDAATATPVETGATVTGRLAAGDRDWFAFDATAGEAILPRLELVGPNEDRSLRVDVFGPDEKRINAYPNDGIAGDPYVAGVDPVGESGPAEGAALAETNGTYYVRVSADDGAADRAGAYALSVATRRLDRFDPNQRPEAATRLTPNVTVNATATAYDPDWFAFDAAAGDRIDVSVDTTPTADMDAALYGPNGTLLRSNDLDGPENLSVTAEQNGTYRAVIRQSELNWVLLDELTYDLAVDVTAADAPTDADGDRLSAAEEAEYGTDPTDTDTDDDGWSDLSEVNRGCDPLNAESHP